MNCLYKLFRQDPDSRSGVIVMTSLFSIMVNAAMAALKIIIGLLANSIAVIAEGVNNATDSLAAIITIAGAKVSRRQPTPQHPFGFGRAEYLTSLLIATVIIVTGIQFLIGSAKLFFHPVQLKTNAIVVSVIAVSAIIKLLFGRYTIRQGRRIDSTLLAGVGQDCCNDSLVSGVTIVSALFFMLTGISIDAIAGMITSLYVVKTGLDLLMSTVDSLLGVAASRQLAQRIYEEIRKTPGIINAADMKIHDYGPGQYSGSVNIELDHDSKLGDVYEITQPLQQRIQREFGVTMVFGVYAVDNDHEIVQKVRLLINDFVKSHDHVLSYHALYIPPDHQQIFCDLLVDHTLRDTEALRRDFLAMIHGHYPQYRVELVIETEFV